MKIRDNATAPMRAAFEHAARRLPEAHRAAQHAGVTHLHQQLTAAAVDADLDPEPIVIAHRRGVPYVGIDQTPAGDTLADGEYGLPEEAPNPVLRQAAKQAMPAANDVYQRHLHHGLGFS